MTLIDLGELRDEPEPYPASRPRRPVDRRWWKALVLVFVLVTAAGSTAVAPALSVRLPGASEVQAFLFGDLLVAVEAASPAAGGGRTVLAYDVPARPTATPSVTLRWRLAVPGTGALAPVADEDGLLLFYSHHVGPGNAEALAVDAASGQVRWRQPGYPLPTGTGLVLLDTTDPGGGGDGTVRGVDLSTGRARWSLPAEAEQLTYGWSEGERIDRLARILPGRIEIRDVHTGRVLDSGPVDAGLPGPRKRVQLVEDLALVVDGSRSRVTAYGAAGLTRRWQATVPAASHVNRCGPVLCVWGVTGGMWALDPATGALRWRSAGWSGVFPAGDRLVAVSLGQSVTNQFAVLDARTGQVLADLGRWHGREFLFQADPTLFRGLPDGRLLLAELDAVTARVRILDVVPGAVGECRHDRTRLLCRQADGSFRLWWYRR